MVADGHLTDIPLESVYSGVVATNHYLPFRAQWS
jgi:hypothetical protein